MSYDTHDTIAAVASAPGGAGRGVVRISGPATVDCLARCFVAAGEGGARLAEVARPTRIEGAFHVADGAQSAAWRIPGALLLWPGKQSYTRQPSAEFHTIGSPPLLAAVVEELNRQGVRPAEPGEFTLRAFLAGRIDLTQAEGVLGVIDAQQRDDLDAALDQLAGGLSRPLHEIREDLLMLLAELEAGLDFVDEDIEFISREALAERIARAQAVLAATRAQLTERDRREELPRVVLAGPPNAGKSSLFNALVDRYGDGDGASAIVSPQAGATRDYVVGRLSIDGFACELVDTAGVEDGGVEGIARAAHAASGVQRRMADVRLLCCETADGVVPTVEPGDLLVITKADLPANRVGSLSMESTNVQDAGGVIRCSSTTGMGLDLLAMQIRGALGKLQHDAAGNKGVAATAARCAGSLQRASDSLAAAASLVDAGADELLAAEVRGGLDALGEMVGAICADDVLDRVFGQFCIGK